MSRGPGIWVTGASRTGTSMVAGLFAAHGVFWGECGEGDHYNPRGYWEHPELVRQVELGMVSGWPDRWWSNFRAEGWTGGPWGVKRGPRAWPYVRLLQPSLIVVCRRPVDQILRSRRRRWPHRSNHRQTLMRTFAELARATEEAACPVYAVHTADLVAGSYASSGILEAFDQFGMVFDREVAAAWIDPAIWDRSRTP